MTESTSSFSQMPERKELTPFEKPVSSQPTTGIGRQIGRLATKAIAVPIQLAAYLPKIGSQVTASPLIKLVAGGGLVTAKVANVAFKATKWVGDVAKSGEFVTTAKAGTDEIIGMSLEKTEKTREATGESVATGAWYAKKGVQALAGVVPFGGAVVTGVEGILEIAKTVEQAERKIEKANIGLVRSGLWTTMECARALWPIAIDWLVSKPSAKLVEATEWLKTKSYQTWTTPSGMSDALTNWGDWLDASAYRQWHAYDETSWVPLDVSEEKSSVSTKTPEEVAGELTAAQINNFTALTDEQRRDILFLVKMSKSFNLSDEQKQLYTEALKNFNKTGLEDLEEQFQQPLEELIAVFHALPPHEKNKLTPSHFHSLDELQKVKLYRIVVDSAKDLTHQERQFLLRPEFRSLRQRGDWQQLKAEDQRKLESILLSHFNNLPGKIQGTLYSLSLEQYEEMSLDAKKGLLQAVEHKIKEMATQEEKITFAATPSTKDIQTLLHLFDTLFTTEEKFLVFSALKAEFLVFSASYDQLSQLIDEKQTELATLDPTSEKAIQLQNLLEWLKDQQELFEKREPVIQEPATEQVSISPSAVEKATETASTARSKAVTSKVATTEVAKPVNMTHVYDLVGPHVASGRVFKDSFNCMGYLSRGVVLAPGAAGWLLCKAIGYVGAPYIPEGVPLRRIMDPWLTQERRWNWPEQAMRGAATAMQIGLSIPLAQSYVVEGLRQLNVPMQEIEQFLMTVPAALWGGVMSSLNYSLSFVSKTTQAVDSTIGRAIDLRKNMDIVARGGFEVPLQQWNERTQFLEQSIATAVKDVCCLAPGASPSAVCTPEVFAYLAHPETWPELAAKSNVELYSPQFFKLIDDMWQKSSLPAAMQTATPSVMGVVTAPVSAFIDTLTSTGADVAKRASDSIYAMLDSLADTWIGHLGRAVQPIASSLKEKAAGAVAGALSGVSSVSTTGAEAFHAGERFLGLRQVMPPEMKKVFDTWITLHTQLAAVKANQETYRFASLALQELESAWYGSLVKTVATSKLAGMAIETYGELAPTIHNSITALQSLSHAGLASEQFLKGQIDAATVEGALPEYMRTMGAAAAEAMNVDAGWGKTVGGTLLSVGTVAELGSGYLTISLMRHVLPHVLRSLGPKVSEYAQPFWYGCAKRLWDAADAAGGVAERSFQTFGSWMQSAFNTLSGSEYIDPARVNNFLEKLSLDEQQHMLDLAIDSPHSSEKEREILNTILPQEERAEEYEQLANSSLQAFDQLSEEQQRSLSGNHFEALNKSIPDRVSYFVHKISREEQDKIVRALLGLIDGEKKELSALHANLLQKPTTAYEQLVRVGLQVFDRLSVQERLQLSATYYDLLDFKTKERIIGVVEKYQGLSNAERADSDVIVDKFNALSESQKAEIEQMTIWEYAALPADEQESLCFALAHSKAFKDFMKEKQLTEKYGYDSATIAADIPPYFERNAQEVQARLKRKYGPIAEELYDDFHAEFKAPLDFAHKQFLQMGKMTNRELQELLPLVNKMSFEEHSLLTPTRLKTMSDAKIKQCLDLVQKYRPDLISEFLTVSAGKYNLNSLTKYLGVPPSTLAAVKHKEMQLVVLATLFHELRPHQQQEILQLTPDEFKAFTLQEKEQLISYLMTQKSVESHHQRLKNELVLLEQGKEANFSFIANTFNSLDLAQQVECREMHELGMQEKKNLEEGVQKEIKKAEGQLKFLRIKTAKIKEKEYMSAQFQRDNIQRDLVKTAHAIAVKRAYINSLDPSKKAEIASKQQELVKLEKEQLRLKAALPPVENKLQVVAKVITELQERQDRLQYELSTLKKLIGQGVESIDELENEPLPSSRQVAINNAVKAAIQLQTEGIQNSHIKVIQDFNGQIADLNNKIANSEEIITNQIEFHKKKLDEIAQLQNKLRKECRAPNILPEEFVRKQMELQGLKTFYIPLHQMLRDVTTSLKTTFIEEAELIKQEKSAFLAV